MIGEEVDREGRPRPQTDSLLISVDSNEGISDEQIITHNFWNEFFDELQQRWICEFLQTLPSNTHK
jgi:uncharacterized membrane protein